MVVCDFTAHISHVKKCKFSPHIQTWMLRDPTAADQFQLAFKVKIVAAVTTAAGANADTANNIESSWSKMMGILLDAATKVCSLSKNHQWKSKTCWWNEQMDKVIQEKHAWFKDYNALNKRGLMAEANGAKIVYQVYGKACRLADKVWDRKRGIHNRIPLWWFFYHNIQEMDLTNQGV